MVLASPPESLEVIADIELVCSCCDTYAPISFVICENWSDQEIDREVADHLFPGKVYCGDCLEALEGELSREELLNAHCLEELFEGSDRTPIRLFDENEVIEEW